MQLHYKSFVPLNMKFILQTLFLFTSLAGYLVATKFRCDYLYKNVGWFKYHRIPATWRDARLRCRYEGGILASPTTAYIKATMIDTACDFDIFTGIYAGNSPGTYRTIDGVPLDAINTTWAENEPHFENYDTENCTSMNYKGELSVSSCEIPRPYVCFRAKSTVSVNECGTIDPEYRFDQRTNKCYKFHTIPRTFARADIVCDAEGGHLAIINSETEAAVLRDVFARYPSNTIFGTTRTDIAIIGYFYWDEEWMTIDGHTLREAGYDKFAQGEPNNYLEKEFCGSIYRNGQLNDLVCDLKVSFICEKHASYPAVCGSSEIGEEWNTTSELSDY